MRKHSSFTFSGSNNEILAHIKWCRQALGERGADWDFSGSTKRVTVMIYNERSASFYTLKYGNKETS